MNVRKLKNEVKKLSNTKKVKKFQCFFKTAKGEYGEGDIFVGIDVPTSRNLANKYKSLKLSDVSKLLKSPFHEEKLIALFYFNYSI